jgi:hypothetical protein
MTLITPSPLLKFGLRLDAAGSSALGALQLLAAGWMSPTLALAPPLLVATGAFMLVYAATLVWMASRPRLPAGGVKFIALGNLGWSAACLGLPAVGVLSPNSAGWGYLVLQALAVALFAALQWAGLKRSAPANASASSGAAATGIAQHHARHGSAS